MRNNTASSIIIFHLLSFFNFATALFAAIFASDTAWGALNFTSSDTFYSCPLESIMGGDCGIIYVTCSYARVIEGFAGIHVVDCPAEL
jgi:hypothetical protein